MKFELIKVIEQELETLPSNLKSWISAHLIQPRKITLFVDFDFRETKEYWLITDHTGVQDSGYRVIYSEPDRKFGLEMRTKEGQDVMIGLYGTLLSAVDSM